MRTGKTILLTVLLVTAGLGVPFFSGKAGAHAPSDMNLRYKDGTLYVGIYHDSVAPNIHYIESVVVKINNAEYLTETYSSQPAPGPKGTIDYEYSVQAATGDEITVTATCSISGSLTETMVVSDKTKEEPDIGVKVEGRIIFQINADLNNDDTVTISAILQKEVSADSGEIRYSVDGGQEEHVSMSQDVKEPWSGTIGSFNEGDQVTAAITIHVGQDSESYTLEFSVGADTITAGRGAGASDSPGDRSKEAGSGNSLVFYGALVIVLISGIVVGLLVWRKKRQRIFTTETVTNDGWTSCPKCGTDLKMKDLPSHLDMVHPDYQRPNGN